MNIVFIFHFQVDRDQHGDLAYTYVMQRKFRNVYKIAYIKVVFLVDDSLLARVLNHYFTAVQSSESKCDTNSRLSLKNTYYTASCIYSVHLFY